MQPPIKAEARTSVEIHDSCNDCCPKFCCFGRKVKKHHRKEIPRANASVDLTQVAMKADKALSTALQPSPPRPESVKYGPMPSLPGGSK